MSHFNPMSLVDPIGMFTSDPTVQTSQPGPAQQPPAMSSPSPRTNPPRPAAPPPQAPPNPEAARPAPVAAPTSARQGSPPAGRSPTAGGAGTVGAPAPNAPQSPLISGVPSPTLGSNNGLAIQEMIRRQSQGRAGGMAAGAPAPGAGRF